MLMTTGRVLRTAFDDFLADQGPRTGAAVAYYTIFSLAPVLVLVVAVGGLVFGEDAARGRLFGEIAGLVGPDAARAIEGMLEHARRPASGLAATAVGLTTLLLGATGVFVELQTAFNQIWRVPPWSGSLFHGFARQRFVSLLLVLAIGFLLLVSLAVSAAMAAVSELVTRVTPALASAWHLVDLVTSLVILSVLFAVMFRTLPDRAIEWRDVWFGAAVTALLFAIGKILIGLYLGHAGLSSAYGAAGSLVVILVWVYYSAQILLLGAEITHVWAERRGAAAAVTTAAPLAGPPPGALAPSTPPRHAVGVRS